MHFEVATAQEFPGSDHDLVTFFDFLHDVSDPVGAAQRVHSSPAPDGIWMVVEPAAGGSLEENFDPVGRVYHRASSMICTSASLCDPTGAGLGARATSGQLCAVARAGGLGRCRLAAKTSFDRVFEFRP